MERNPIWKHSTSVPIWGLYPSSGFNCPFFVTPACLADRYMCVCVKSLQLCLTLHDAMDCCPSGSSVHGILRTRTREWVAIPSSRGCSPPRDQTYVSCSSCFACRKILYHWAIREAQVGMYSCPNGYNPWLHLFLDVPVSLLSCEALENWKLITLSTGEGNGTPLQYSCLENPMDRGAWWAAIHGIAKSRARLSNFTFTFPFHVLEKEMAVHSSVLAWRIPRMGEPGGLPSLGSHRVGHNWSDSAAAAATLSTSWE